MNEIVKVKKFDGFGFQDIKKCPYCNKLIKLTFCVRKGKLIINASEHWKNKGKKNEHNSKM